MVDLSYDKGGNMANKEYLPLTEYSTKYNLSISTLRRRIKSKKVNFILDGSKYLLLDKPMDKHEVLQATSKTDAIGSHLKPSVSSQKKNEPFSKGLQGISQTLKDSRLTIQELSGPPMDTQKSLGLDLDSHEQRVVNLDNQDLDSRILGQQGQTSSEGSQNPPSTHLTHQSPSDYPGGYPILNGIPVEPCTMPQDFLTSLQDSDTTVESTETFSSDRELSFLDDQTETRPQSRISPPQAPNPTMEQDPINTLIKGKRVNSISGSFQIRENSSQDLKNILATTNRLLAELKKAYALILQEKEEEIILIKDEVTNLKTLVSVLEEENQRLRGEGQSKLQTPRDWKEGGITI